MDSGKDNPDKDGSPELYRLVTRYQLHKCSKYCKRRKKCGQHSFIGLAFPAQFVQMQLLILYKKA